MADIGDNDTLEPSAVTEGGITLVDWAEVFPRALSAEILRSERRRITILIGYLAFFYVLYLFLILVPGVMEAPLLQKYRALAPHATALFVGAIGAISIFGQHVSPQVAEKLLNQPIEFGGELRTVSVMFLDIRDFGRIAAQKTPQQVMHYLNTFFACTIDVVNQHRGIVNKFLGDGFVAVFGAPLDDAEQCTHAVDAGLAVLDQVDRMNADGAIPATRVGIGLHLGEVVTGNVGSLVRKEYTIIGDAVNLASRIEQATKQFRSQFLISEAVWSRIDRNAYRADDLGPVLLKGQSKPVRIYKIA